MKGPQPQGAPVKTRATAGGGRCHRTTRCARVLGLYFGRPFYRAIRHDVRPAGTGDMRRTNRPSRLSAGDDGPAEGLNLTLQHWLLCHMGLY